MDSVDHSLVTGEFLLGGGELGALTRNRDWTHTPVGPIRAWPQSLRTAVSILLSSRYPMFLFWGKEAVCFYNDGYRPSLGAHKHPQALGQLGAECWSDIWHIIGPQIEGVMTRGDVTWFEDQLVPFDRSGYFEEVYFTYSYSPVRDESGGVGGTLVVCSETTDHVVGKRRMRTLHDLATASLATQGSMQAIQNACAVLARNQHDVPFVILHAVEDGLPVFQAGATTDYPWPLQCVAESGMAELVEDLDSWPVPLAGGAWPERTRQAFLQPICLGGRSKTDYVLVAGVSPRKAFDASYKTFFELAASQISSAIAEARSYEAEKRQVAALAELDRAKTEFFGNISHELRTPLTLMLGPLEQLIASGGLTSDQGLTVELAHRNSLRLLQLVNALLDFSRIEAGRIDASYRLVDLSRLTGDLAGVFRAAIEGAGLEYIVDCAAIAEPIYVDSGMWEKIVFNLLSNAFKFTMKGRICVTLRLVPGYAQLTVADTGSGIPEHEIGRVFERFHRVSGALGRSHEGSGIGLALARELVQLHGGTISLESVVGAGTSFTVRIPVGCDHLPADQLSSGLVQPSEFSDFSAYLHRSSGAVVPTTAAQDSKGIRSRVVYVDDNPDMRSYVAGLLAPQFDVAMFANGAMALQAAIANPPDLILSDVMMPVMDGLTLVDRLRRHSDTRDIPIVLLSARSGEESSISGLQAGADDYLSKPFSARELTARIKTHLALRQERRRARNLLIQTFEQAPVAIAVHRGPDLIYDLVNPLYQSMLKVSGFWGVLCSK